MRGLERDLDRLYGLPLAEFVAGRNELARRLKAAGDDADAKRVSELPKPSIPAWVVNQLARHDPDAVRALLAAGKAVVEAQQRLVRGSGDAEALRTATARQREVVANLVRLARGVLAESGRPATPSMAERIAQTLNAAAVEDEGRRLLESGRLTVELEPAGFGAFAAVPSGGRRRASSPRDELAERRRAKEERQQRKRDLQQRVRELERAAQDAERDAERAAKAAADARELADRARAAADEAAVELAELE
jgi:hypothetical protein